MNGDHHSRQEDARWIAARTRYPAACPRWLRPLIHVFRQRDGDRRTGELLERLNNELACQQARITELEEMLAQVSPRPRLPSRVFLDVSGTNFNDNRTGIQRVVRNLAREFAALSRRGAEIIPVKLESGRVLRADEFLGKIGITGHKFPDTPHLLTRPGDTLIVLDAGWAFFEGYRRAIQNFNAEGGVTLGIVYDLIPLNMPWFTDAAGTANFTLWLDMLTNECHGLICISRAVADDVGEHLRKHVPGRVGELPMGHFHLGGSIEEITRSTAADVGNTRRVRQARDAAALQLLVVGTLEPRKGHIHALEACERLWARGADISLVFAGSGTWQPAPVVGRIESHAEYDKRLFWLRPCDDAELHALYAGADALLFPSLAEGFGLPLLEAAAMNLPIICSDIPVFREICGDFATYFRAGDSDALADTILGWQRLREAKRLPDVSAMPRLDWRGSATMLLEVVQRLAKQVRPQSA